MNLQMITLPCAFITHLRQVFHKLSKLSRLPPRIRRLYLLKFLWHTGVSHLASDMRTNRSGPNTWTARSCPLTGHFLTRRTFRSFVSLKWTKRCCTAEHIPGLMEIRFGKTAMIISDRPQYACNDYC